MIASARSSNANVSTSVASGRRPMSACAHPWRAGSCNFLRNDKGTTAVVFALIASAFMAAVAVMIDYGRATGEHSRMQWALDAAALAASDFLGLPDGNTDGEARAKAMFKANFGRDLTEDFGKVTMDGDNGEVVVVETRDQATTFMKTLGVNSVKLHTRTKVAKGNGNVEIALVLDTSGSMAGAPLDELKVAAHNLVSVVFTGNEGTERVSFGVVPFAGAVNVGSGNAGASWMDREALSPIHSENFESRKSRFSLFSQMNVNWAGCVEARPSPYDVSDAPPSSATPGTLFVPLFAPDEPDANNSLGKTYYNNYLDDAGGACEPLATTCTRYSWRGNCTRTETETLEPAEAQARLCKYDGGNANTRLAYGTRKGPNMLCDSSRILPLNTDKQTILDSIDAMVAKGGTNIPEGVMWGWRVLSPGAPFMEGRDYEAESNKKFMIIMSDGANWHGGLSNQNRSWFSAFGYASKNRLGSGSTSTRALKSAMNAKTAEACANAKAAGVVVYTVAYDLSDTTTVNLLRNCASDSNKALAASNGATLATTFETIGRDISRLRITN